MLSAHTAGIVPTVRTLGGLSGGNEFAENETVGMGLGGVGTGVALPEGDPAGNVFAEGGSAGIALPEGQKSLWKPISVRLTLSKREPAWARSPQASFPPKPTLSSRISIEGCHANGGPRRLGENRAS